MEDDECPVHLPEDVAVKWNFKLFKNPFSEMCNTDGKSTPVISLLDIWCDFETSPKIQNHVIQRRERISNQVNNLTNVWTVWQPEASGKQYLP